MKTHCILTERPRTGLSGYQGGCSSWNIGYPAYSTSFLTIGSVDIAMMLDWLRYMVS